ncbi:glycosyltransferase family 2 protein [Calothrix rhizosoleniae]|uniref:glycosyltransferase family 2 protein n=1 Tax=Calothrix rhizosoleniae TaxID=888997 RepID=UPI002E12D3F8
MLFLPIAVLFIECSAALLLNFAKKHDCKAHRPNIAVLVPAHNEADGITATLNTLILQLKPQDQLIVIADNCSDETAAIASQSGVTVIERQDYKHRGKGYALDYALKFLEANPPEVVVNVDADCIVYPGTIDQIARLAAATKRPVQSTYLMIQPSNSSPKDKISALAVKVKNLVRPIGLQQLDLPCLLTGSGMAFPWSVIRTVSLANSKTVDDMQLGLDLAIAGYPPLYCQDAQVIGRLMEKQAAKSQRRRWEHGHIETLVNQVPRLIKASMNQKRFDLLAIALDLSIPPLSLLVIIWSTTTLGGLFLGILAGVWMPGIVLAIEGLILTISIFVSWAKFGRDDVSVLTLLTIPFYILSKITLYLAFLVKPQTQWIRTERDVVDFTTSSK